MKNLVILFISILFINSIKAQRWSSSFVGKLESRALYASNVAKAIQTAWENELSLKGKKEMLLDEIIFGHDNEPKEKKSTEIAIPIMNNIDEIEEILGIKEVINLDSDKKKTETPKVTPIKITPVSELGKATSTGNIEQTKEVKLTLPTEKYVISKTSLNINNDDIEADSIYAIPQVRALFLGGASAMKSFFAKNIIMPENDGQSVKGKVFVRFVVKKNGELAKIYMVKGLTDACNKEALRVVKKMPSWIPAMQEGEKVNSWHTLPIYFEIE
jgi:TonB family protein